MNWSPLFAIGLLIVLLAGVAAVVVFVGLFNIAMVIGPALIVVVAVIALVKAGEKARLNGQVPPRR